MGSRQLTAWEVISYSLEKPFPREDILTLPMKYIFSGHRIYTALAK